MQRNRGFTLIEVLVVVGILGILASIGIWNYYDSINKSRQKRTMADIRAIGEAWEARAIDVKAYNAAAAGFTMPATPLTWNEMTTLLAPTYMRNIPRIDGWSNAFDFAADQPVGGAPATEYAIRSAGRDGTFQGAAYTPGTTTDFDCDIVFSGGSFVVWPEGQQGH